MKNSVCDMNILPYLTTVMVKILDIEKVGRKKTQFIYLDEHK